MVAAGRLKSAGGCSYSSKSRRCSSLLGTVLIGCGAVGVAARGIAACVSIPTISLVVLLLFAVVPHAARQWPYYVAGVLPSSHGRRRGIADARPPAASLAAHRRRAAGVRLDRARGVETCRGSENADLPPLPRPGMPICCTASSAGAG